MTRTYLDVDPSGGYPTGPDLFYACRACGGSVRSRPSHHEPWACPCGGVKVDSDAGRVSAADPRGPRVYRVASSGQRAPARADVWWVERARAAGPLAPGRWRVVVIEADLRLSHRDFADLAAARAYAADAAAESDDRPPVAAIVDASFAVLREP